MRKYTIVRSNRLNAFGDFISDDAKVMEMFEMTSAVRKLEVELCLKTHVRIPKHLFNQRLIGMDTEVIIVFDGHARPEFLRWLADKNPGKRLIFWCWNAVSEIEKNLKLKHIPDVYEKWSYSELDCKKYGMMHNTTFYWNKFSKKQEREKEIDLYFIGKDKGRYQKIKELETELATCGVRCLFQIIPTHMLKMKKGLCSRIPYEKVLENLSKTKGILDMKITPDAGPSLRPIEAVFYGKKLVTDNEEVRKMKFYDASNILILNRGGYCPLEIKKFLDIPFAVICPEDIVFYSAKNWLARFEHPSQTVVPI